MPDAVEVQKARDLCAIVEKQEGLVQFETFTADDGFAIGSLIRSNFLKHHATDINGIAIAIELFNGDTLFKGTVGNKRLGVRPENWHWMAAKQRVVMRYNRSSFYVGRDFFAAGADFGRFGPPPLGLKDGEAWAMHGGAVPIWIKGCTAAPVGVVLVSGLPQEKDHQLIMDTLAEYLGIKDLPSVLSVQ